MPKHLLLLPLFLLVSVLSLSAQCTINYAYDAGGNRVARTANCPPHVVAEPVVSSAVETRPSGVEAALQIEEQAQLDLTTVTLYPNPTVESFTLAFSGSLPTDGLITLLDASGRRLVQLPLSTQPYSLAAYPTGSYRVLLQTPTQRHLLSVVKSGH